MRAACVRACLPVRGRVCACMQVGERRRARQSCCASLSPCSAAAPDLLISLRLPLKTLRTCGERAAAFLSACLSVCEFSALISRHPPAPVVTPQTGLAEFTIWVSPPTVTQVFPAYLCGFLPFFPPSVAHLLDSFHHSLYLPLMLLGFLLTLAPYRV